MDFFNTILLFAELGSKIGNIDIDNKFPFDIKAFRRHNNLSFVRHIPNFDNNKNHIVVNGKKVFVGTILKRPLDNIVQEVSSVDFEYHYAVVLGTSTDNKEILIEMTKGRNINVITKQEFLVDKFHEHDIEIYSPYPKDITRQQIIERAKEFQFDSYDLLDLNCKVFVEYIVWGFPRPQRKVELQKFQLELCELTINMRKLYLSNPDNLKYRDFLTRSIKQAEDTKKILTAKINKASDKRTI